MEALKHATEIVRILKDHGHTAYFAGGWVRDFIMGHPSSDIDIATTATPDLLLKLFSHTIHVGIQFAVVIVVIDGHQFEVSTFRKDIEYKNGRTPERIEFCDPEEDALRRDFTINGMFYDPIEDVVHDFVHGKRDIDQRIIRTIGNPNDRFIEDRLRLIRAIRFAYRFGFHIDPETREAIRENAITLFPAVAIERVWQELQKMADAPRFDEALIEMHRLELLPTIFPLLKEVHLDEIKQRVQTFARYPENVPSILYLMQLFPDSSLEEKQDICGFLKVSNRDRNLMEFHHKSTLLLQKEKVSDFEWAHFYAHPHAMLCMQIISNETKQHVDNKNRLQLHIDRIKNKTPLISSQLLREAGIHPGALMGDLMKEGEKIAINQDLHDPHVVLEKLIETSIWPV